ncbi:MAG: enoyl-CoA hydratase [Candidatus Azotimanducaceae bacterium]|jgi:enoyl-CoA hydratase
MLPVMDALPMASHLLCHLGTPCRWQAVWAFSIVFAARKQSATWERLAGGKPFGLFSRLLLIVHIFMSDFSYILYNVTAPLALITINRPAKHNAISLATLEELHQAVDLAAADESVRVIAITGAGGRAFASGSDLNEVAERDLRKALEPLVQGLADQLEALPKPTIAAIDGICMGGGLEIALGCDLRVCTPESRFATPEGKLGIIPGGGATARLPRVVGRGWGLEMLLMGEPIKAERAIQIGLVTRIVEPDELMSEVQRMADHLASFAPFVPQFMKAMVHQGMEGSLASALAMEKFAQGALVQTEDKTEGISAFLEKRKPTFKGR